MRLEGRVAAAALAALAAGAGLAACGKGEGPEGPRAASRGAAIEESAGQRASNQDVMTRLSPSCAACHGDGTNKPFFASLDAFETLLVFNSRYVVAGQPDQSELLRLLAGQGTGAFKQMPLSGDPFAALAASGQAKITMAELGAWITGLKAPGAPSAAGSGGVVMRRLTAEQITRSLFTQLGLDDGDFWSINPDGAPREANVTLYPARSPDALPFDPGAIGHSDSPRAAWTRFEELGGPDWWGRGPRRQDISPTFTQSLVQTAQAWCAVAVAKPNNAVFFRDAAPGDTSAGAEASIRKNIGSLYLTMIGEVPQASDVDLLFTSIFLPYEKQSTALAWTATCAALVRHPLWLSY